MRGGASKRHAISCNSDAPGLGFPRSTWNCARTGCLATGRNRRFVRSAAIFTLLATLCAAMTGVVRPCDADSARFTPVPIVAEASAARTLQTPAPFDTVRGCIMPSWFDPAVGWGIQAMYADPHLVRPSGGAGIKVGVVDAGVAPHPDVARRVVKCMN